MVFIDAQGKLFGRVNLFDLLILLALVAGAGLFFESAFLRPEKVGEIQEITVVAKDIQPEIANSIQAGDLVYNAKYLKTKPVAAVEAILAKNAAVAISTDLRGKQVIAEHPVHQDVKLLVHFVEPIQVWPTRMVFHGRPMSLRIGDEITLENFKYSLTVQVLSQTLVVIKK